MPCSIIRTKATFSHIPYARVLSRYVYVLSRHNHFPDHDMQTISDVMSE